MVRGERERTKEEIRMERGEEARKRMAKGREAAKLSAESCIYYGASQQLKSDQWPAARTSTAVNRRFSVEKRERRD